MNSCTFCDLTAYRGSGRFRLAQRCRDQLFEEHIGLAISIAVKMKRKTPAPLDDLKQEASIGLLKAIDRFDHTRGLAFSSFAVPLIRGQVLHYLRDREPIVRPPRSDFDNYQAVISSQKALEEQGYVFSRQKVAELRGIPPERWRGIVAICESRKVDLDFDLPSIEFDEDELPQVDPYELVGLLPRRSRGVFWQWVMGKTHEELAVDRGESVDEIRRSIEESQKFLASNIGSL